MKTSYLRLIITLIASAALSACAHYELIRSRSQGPSPDLDHCPICLDLGQAWAFFRMGAYEDAQEYCALVIEEEGSANGKHVRRARDLSLLSEGYLALRARDYPTARAVFREISDPQLRALGQQYVESESPVSSQRSPREELRTEQVLDGGTDSCPEQRVAALLRLPSAHGTHVQP